MTADVTELPRLVAWHDVECGAYGADLPLWRRLAERASAPVLDVGAGTGRVALDLAARGHDVTALDREPALLAELRTRAAAERLTVATSAADARAFDLGPARFGLILVPMQTLQLLGGAAGRAAFLACARRHARPGALLAAALADVLEPFAAGSDALLPAPDRGERDGWRLASQPVAVREEPDAWRIERIRTLVAPDGRRSAEADVIRLDRVDAAGLAAEAAAHGWRPEAPHTIASTEDHVGSTVVMLRA